MKGREGKSRNAMGRKNSILPILAGFTRLNRVTAPVKNRSHWKIRRFDSHEELRCQQVKDWQALSGADRRKAAWELVVDYWVGMKGMHPDELRLQRSVTKLTRM